MDKDIKKALAILKAHAKELTQGQNEFYRSCQRQLRRGQPLSERQSSILAEIATEITDKAPKKPTGLKHI